MEELFKEGAKQAEGVLTEAYKDLLSPTLQPIGQIISYIPRAIRVAAFGKVEKWIVSGEENIKRTSEIITDKLKDIPEEKLTDTEPYIIVPAIQQLSYTQNNEVLRNLYANLIASSMMIDKKPLVHPSFIDIIKQLTPDEAKILQGLDVLTLRNAYPLVRVVANRGNDQDIIASNFTNISIEILDYPLEIPTYLDNLERLKLITISTGSNFPKIDLFFKDVKNKAVQIYGEVIKELEYDELYISRTKYFTITSFGISFIKTCCQ